MGAGAISRQHGLDFRSMKYGVKRTKNLHLVEVNHRGGFQIVRTPSPIRQKLHQEPPHSRAGGPVPTERTLTTRRQFSNVIVRGAFRGSIKF
jgi:hypothetical protein